MALPGVGVASCGRHGAAPPLPSGRGRWWRHLSRLREGSQVSVGSSARVKRTKKVIRPAETFKFRPVRAAGEGWLLKRKGGGPEGGPKMQPGVGAAERNGEGAEPPGTAGWRGPLRPKGRCSFGLQTSAFSLDSFLLCPGLKMSLSL